MQPLDALAALARLPDRALGERAGNGDHEVSLQFVLYDLLRHEQRLAATAGPSDRPEIARILDLVQMAYGDLVGLLVGRDDDLLESARDGEWTLRDLLRHAMAVELRYAAQVQWAATRRNDEPLPIPEERLPCDRLSPAEPDFADSRTGGVELLLRLLGEARGRTDALLEPLSDTILSRPSLWTQVELSVRMRLHQSAAHLTEVVVQTEKMLRTEVDGDVRRILRRCCSMRGLHQRWSDAAEMAELDARCRRLAAATRP